MILRASLGLALVVVGCGGSVAPDDASPARPNPPPAASSAAPPSRAPWPMLGQGPSHQSRSPSARGDAPHRTWQVHVGETIRSSCAIAEDGTVYAAGTHALYAIAPNGTLAWSVPVAADQSSPAIGPDGTVYVVDASRPAALDAFTRDGVLKWRAPITGGPELATLSSPTVAPDGTIYAAAMDGALNAVAPDGRVRWSRGTDRYSAPAIDASGALFTMQLSSYATHVDAFRADGAPIYHADGLGFTETYFNYPVLGHDGAVYVAATSLFALGAGGERRWARREDALAPPAVGADGTLYASVVGAVVAALRPTDGSRVWTYTEGSSDYGGSVAVAADGTVYVGGNQVRVLSASGALLRTIDVGARVTSSLALDADGAVVFAADDGTVYAR